MKIFFNYLFLFLVQSEPHEYTICFEFCCFETGAQAGLKLALQPGITLNSASCICVLSVEITGRNHLPDFMNPGIHACYTSILPTELHTVLRPRSVF